MLRDDLLDSALRTLNHDPTSSMATLATEAGISRATLNRQFSSRDTLLRELGERGLDRWEASLNASGVADVIAEGGSAEALRRAFESLIHRYVEDVDTFGFTLTETRLEAFPDLADRAEELGRREYDLYAAAQRAGVLRSDVTPQWISWSLFGLLVGARDGLRHGDLARRGLEDIAVSTFFGGCGQ